MPANKTDKTDDDETERSWLDRLIDLVWILP